MREITYLVVSSKVSPLEDGPNNFARRKRVARHRSGECENMAISSFDDLSTGMYFVIGLHKFEADQRGTES